MSADLIRRSLLVMAGLLVASGGVVLMVAARGWSDLVPPTSEMAVVRILSGLQAHDAAARNGDEPARMDNLRAARSDLTALLARRPSDGDQWALLAQIEASVVGFDPGVKAALDMSRLTARLERAAIDKRIRLGVQLWTELDETERARVTGDIQTLLSVPEPRHRVIATLADAARGQDAPRLAMVRKAIGEAAPQWLTTFEQFLVNPPQF